MNKITTKLKKKLCDFSLLFGLLPHESEMNILHSGLLIMLQSPLKTPLTFSSVLLYGAALSLTVGQLTWSY